MRTLTFTLSSLLLLSCAGTPLPPLPPESVDYMAVTETAEEEFYFPLTDSRPSQYWTCVNVQSRADRNDLGAKGPYYGLQYHLLAQSLAGIVNRAMDEGRVPFGIWLDASGTAYEMSRAALGTELGRKTAIDLVLNNADIRGLVEGYVLTDLVSNPESNMAATVASHVYDAIIVDERDRSFFDEAGFSMVYDARGKSTSQAWTEFKDRCSGKALVVMPVQTGELREFVIKNRLFIVNLNREYANPSAGQNDRLLEEVLASLERGAPVIGWEQGVGEDIFVGRVSEYGNVMLAADWSYNHSLTGAGASRRQPQALAKVLNPKEIDYSSEANYVSFYLSDGDNYQWVMSDSFVNFWYGLPSGASCRMSYGLCSEALCQLSPDGFEYLYGLQPPGSTLMECLGGGYYYVDTYASRREDRKECLEALAGRVAVHMRRHRLKVLNLVAKDWNSAAAKEAYQAFIDANDELEGIIAFQYAPYTAGGGKVLWCTNKAGYDIPVVSTEYALWQGISDPSSGTPSEVASYVEANNCKSTLSFSPIVVHAWSEFSGKRGADAASMCMGMMPSTVRAVSVQELVWRIRMSVHPEQTKRYLDSLK